MKCEKCGNTENFILTGPARMGKDAKGFDLIAEMWVTMAFCCREVNGKSCMTMVTQEDVAGAPTIENGFDLQGDNA